MGRRRSPGNERLGQYVQRRAGGALELRFPIPADVRSAFLDESGQPRSKVIRSLGTSDVKLANSKADVLRGRLQERISSIRAARSSPDVGSYLRRLFDQELDLYRAQSATHQRERLRAALTPGSPSKVAEREGFARHAWANALLSDDPDERRAAAGWAADDYYRRVLGMEPDTGSPEYLEILDACAGSLAESIIAQNALDRGEPIPITTFPAVQPPPERTDDGNQARNERGRMRLGRYFEDVYLKEKAGAGLRGDRSIEGKRDAMGLFGGLISDKRIFEITADDIWQFHNDLGALPDRRFLRAADRELPLQAIIRRVRSGDISAGGMNPKTINKHLTAIRTVLQHAVDRRDIVKNAASGIRAEVPEEEETGRAFTTAELNRIFSLPLFTGCREGEVEGGLFKPGSVRIRDDRFWLPLVLLFTGARSSEIAGLMTEDVFPDHEVPHLIIRPNALRMLKNKQSKRMVPLHPVLIQAGFSEFARAQIEAGERQQFPMIETNRYRDGATGALKTKSMSSALILRKFNRTHLAHAEANRDGGSIKCFRNTFEQESLARIPSDELRRRLTGRDIRSTASIYTTNVPADEIMKTDLLHRLLDGMKSIEYRGLDLSRLMPGDGCSGAA